MTTPPPRVVERPHEEDPLRVVEGEAECGPRNNNALLVSLFANAVMGAALASLASLLLCRQQCPWLKDDN